MKRRVILFLCIAVLMLMLVPTINISLNQPLKTSGDAKQMHWWSRANLYRLDFLMPWLARLAYPFGISISPTQVVIGRDGWLYLGDKYAQGISLKRHPASTDDLARIERIDTATRAWKDWFESQGVRLYRIQLVPDKNSVYPEFLPVWAQPVPDHATNRLRERVSPAIYVDNRPALLEAKATLGQPLYYRTDSHWNAAGAWIGYRDLAETIRISNSDIQWLTLDQVRLSAMEGRLGMDLGSFLWMGSVLNDTEISIDIDRSLPTEQTDFESGERSRLSSNPRISAPQRPLLVRSPNALNQARLLWFRDSFGTAMTPLMAATFSETLQVNYGLHDPEQIARLVRDFKPDYVIVTAIERASLSDWFQQLPPNIPERAVSFQRSASYDQMANRW